MCAKVFAFLALTSLVNANDVIVGLKTDGKKFFDENRQANPALWRQMDNVTIKAPENEVISRIVITDLRPEKDGDVKVVEGGEGQNNVTIELKSPTVLRGYEFHIEIYSSPEEQIGFTNEQPTATENVQDNTSAAISTNPTTNLDTTSKIPELSTDKINPAILSNDDMKENGRQGRNAKDENNVSTEGTTELTSTTLNSDVSTTPATKHTETATEKRSETNSDEATKFGYKSTIPPIPINKNFDINPAVPAISGKDIANDNVNGNNETRHVRDTEKEKSGKTTETNPTSVRYESSTETEKEATTTEIRDSIPVEENFEGNKKDIPAPKSTTFDNHKYTSIVSSKAEQPTIPVSGKDIEKPRNVRGTEELEKINDNGMTTTEPSETTTADTNDETSTTLSDDCITTEAAEAQNPVDIVKDTESKPDMIPVYLNNRQWNQRFNPPVLQTDQKTPDIKVYPAVLTNDQSTPSPDTADAESLGNSYKPSPDHMENRNPKFGAISRN